MKFGSMRTKIEIPISGKWVQREQAEMSMFLDLGEYNKCVYEFQVELWIPEVRDRHL